MGLLLLSASPPSSSLPRLTWTVKKEPEAARKDGRMADAGSRGGVTPPDIGTEGLQVEKKFQIKVLRHLPWISITELASA